MMKYDLKVNGLENWCFSEEEFNIDNLGKTEAIMYQGNGYMGIRAANEEKYINETRNTFVSGTFNKFDEYEVTELPNLADLTNINISIDKKRFSLEQGVIKKYRKALNIKTGELTRNITWVSPTGKEIEFKFNRVVSLKNLHLTASKVEIIPVTDDIEVKIISGINAQATNTGTQHFHEGEKRIYDKKYIQLIQTTTQSKVDIVLNTVHSLKIDGIENNEIIMNMDRRKVEVVSNSMIKKGQVLELEKISNIFTSIDKEYENEGLEKLREVSIDDLKKESEKGYFDIANESEKEWEKKVWNIYPFKIDCKEKYDLLAIRFALYHLTIMTPAHDSRMGIGAKALSGEGYKGHSFWDTEIFILPFFIYSNPTVARGLLEYRYKGLAGARRKATENGYEGAMYPWEAAWPTDGEVTPLWGAVDIITGKQTKIWSGIIEQHITADISNAVWQYYMITGDEEFMDSYGYEILFDTAIFWTSRLEWNDEKNNYGINNVIGPDEYKEHIDNNAFTNHMVHHNILLAIEYCKKIEKDNRELYEVLNKKLNLEKAMKEWLDKKDKIYLPEANENNIVPQDDTYLNKEVIDLTKYKNQDKVGSMFLDYNLDQVNEMQVSKQADIMMLFYLLENRFSSEVKKASYDYYEPKTLHDSSLSLSTHCILANDLGDKELSYKLFKKATEIDLGPLMNTSDHGVHAASIGGMWQCIVMGFAGVRMLGGKLRINPSLPDSWNELEFMINWKGQRLIVNITKNNMVLKSTGEKEMEVEVKGQTHKFTKILKVNL